MSGTIFLSWPTPLAPYIILIMKLQFKQQQFQLDAVSAVVDLFQGQQRHDGLRYMADPGRGGDTLDLIHDAYRNAPITVTANGIKSMVNQKQSKYNIKPSAKLSIDTLAGRDAYNFTVEMETGTGKTYTYIRTIMELNKRYGWLKFIIVVPSVAIREGVHKSFQTMTEHFQMLYGKKPRYFIYDSKRLGALDDFANSSNIEVMIINSQAFNATGKDARRIHMEQESFRWRKPIDVLAATNPIMIIDEPQSVEGKKTKERLADFKPLFTLRYSATHKEKYDMVYRLDAMDAYNKKLVKKIAVKAIEKLGTTGTEGYLYLQEIIPQKTGGPKAKIEFELLGKNGIRRQTKTVSAPFDLYAESGEMEQYRDGWTLSQFDARYGTIQIGVNRTIQVGQVIGETNEDDMRRIQIRETIKSHLEKEERLYDKGIKVLSLFFIDEVAKYKAYDANHDAHNGDYAEIFEEEYRRQVRDYLGSHKASRYRVFLEKAQQASSAHAGYFSVDKVKKSTKTVFVDYKSATEKKNQSSNDQDAYDLIMKDKERLLSFDEPVRFIFSHSALKEGWDNPNVFQICTLKQSAAETRKRQEIGRGMRLSVDQNGMRQDQDLLGDQVHDINKLTVIANESYDAFARSLQGELKEILSERPQKVEAQLFVHKILENEAGAKLQVSEDIANELQFTLIRNGYVDKDGQLTDTFYEEKERNQLVFPESVSGFEEQVLEVLDSVYDAKQYKIDNANDTEIVFSEQVNEDNLARQEFLNLWKSINRKSSYQVTFDDEELIAKSIQAINDKLEVKKIKYVITDRAADKMTKEGLDFTVSDNSVTEEYVDRTKINTRYDLLGEIADGTGLTRRVVASILSQIHVYKFDMFRANPEDFILRVSRLINEEKATQVVQHIEYHILDDAFDTDIFYDNTASARLSDSTVSEATKSVYNYIKVDSLTEKTFKDDLEAHEDVKVYVKLPQAFKIPTPLGNYNPDWAIAFKEGSVKHVYFVAETKGSMSSLQLKEAEQDKIKCAQAHFKALQEAGYLSHDVIYRVVDSYEKLMEIVK